MIIEEGWEKWILTCGLMHRNSFGIAKGICFVLGECATYKDTYVRAYYFMLWYACRL